LTFLLVLAVWTSVSLAAALPIARRLSFHERTLNERCGLALAR